MIEFDTISSISTPMGEGAIGIVRLSGTNAIKIADTLYKGKYRLTEVESHTMNYGHIIDPHSHDAIDEVMIAVMKAPKTYTSEDVVEINCHGGIHSLQQVLQLTLKHGARLAEPGEFTKRAFLNGRIDLTQAEGVMDIIHAKTSKASKVALQQINGRLKMKIETLRQYILEILAQVEVNIDYPEYDDVEEATTELLKSNAQYVSREITSLLQTASQGKIMRDGLSTVIVGRPNVGKSSLLNAMIQDNKAIVTDIAGTTRDVLEEFVNIRGVPLRLIDTAGIRETEDIVEKIGVERSHTALKQADLVLYVINQNETLNEDDYRLMDYLKNEEVIVIINKVDLEQRVNIDEIKSILSNAEFVYTSITTDQGIDELEESIASLFFDGSVEMQDATYLSNARHIQLIEQAKESIEDALSSAEEGVPIDLVQIDLIKTWELLGEVIGAQADEGLIDQLFSQFCLGK